jgi:cobalt/nickel transport system permease protein
MPERYRPARPGAPLIGGLGTPPMPLAQPTYRPFAPSGAAPPKQHEGEHAERAKLGVYIAAIVLASALGEPLWLALGIAGALLLAGRDAPALARRALLATLWFSGVVSLAYLGQSLWQTGALPWRWLLTANLRVLLMTLLTFLFIARVNLFAALSFSRRLSFMLVLAVSQASGLRRTLADFRLALQARGMRRGALRARYRAAAHAAVWLLDRALANAHEAAQAMQARGLFR